MGGISPRAGSVCWIQLLWRNMMRYIVAPTKRMKLLELLNDTKKKDFLQMVLASVVDVRARAFCEGHIHFGRWWSTGFKCYDQILGNAHYPKWMFSPSVSLRERRKQYANKCVQPNVRKSKFCGDSVQLKDSLNALKQQEWLYHTGLLNADVTAIDSLGAFPCPNNQTILNNR